MIGSKLEYQKKVTADALLQCYERKYKANHAKTGRESDISAIEFQAWLDNS